MPDIPGNSSTTSTVSVGGSASGTLETLADHDWFRITLTAGQSITVFLDGITLEDPYLYIRTSAGQLLYENDDRVSGSDRDSQVSFTATSSGTYYIDVGAFDENYTGNYTVSVSVYTPPPLATMDQIANQLVEGYWGGDDHNFNVTQGGSLTVNLTALTPAGQNLAREALKLWSDVIGVQFVEVATGGQITFDDNESGAFSDGVWSGGITTSAHVNVSTQWLTDYGTGLNSYSFQTYIHEIGHALGLGHAGNYNGEANYPYDASFENDAWATSIMSYFSQTDNTYFAGRGFTENFIVTPMVADIIAMSTLYGLSTTTRTGNTTYGFNSTAGRAEYDATLNPSVAYTIFDSGGNDTLDYSGFANNQVINLNPETFSNVGTEIGNVSIARGVIIENAITGAGSDTLIGNAAANTLTGNAGGDTLDGGAGADTLIGGLDHDTYVVDNLGDVTIENAGQGTDQVNSLLSWTLGANVENLTLLGSASINGTGNGLDNFIIGNAGVNLLSGGSGNDTMNGGDGNDTLDGGAGMDNMNGGAGNDTFIVDTLGDFVQENAGEGVDVVNSAISYTLTANVENLVLTGSADITGTGNSSNNTITGNAGSNFLTGADGDDYLDGGAGADQLHGGLGNDTFVVDNAVDFIQENLGAGTDTVLSSVTYVLNPEVENLTLLGSGAINGTGSFRDNVIAGNTGANVLDGKEGNDNIGGDAGNDTLLGGLGNDTLDGGVGNDILTGGTGTDTLIGGAGDDSFRDAAAGLSGDTITSFVAGDQIVITDANAATFNFSLSGNTLTYSGGSLTFGSALSGTLAATAAVGGGVQLTLQTASDPPQTFNGGSGNDTLNGGSGSDTLNGNAGNDILNGNGGNDILNGGSGADRLTGGTGDDRYYIDDGGDVVIELPGQGDDWLFVLGTYTLEQGASIETLVAVNQSSTEPLVLTGNEFGQSLYGNQGDNYLNGGQASDYLVGLGGNDSLLGGTGADHMAGGVGNDVYYVDEIGDLITEVAGEGNDLLVATASYTLEAGTSIETMTTEQNSAPINLTGNELGQSLYGNAGNNDLTGGGGSDYLVGGAGNDRYFVDNLDFIAENVGGGDDTIFVADTYILREGAEIETLVAANQDSLGAVNLTGNEFGQSLYGSQGANGLNGGAGNDYLVGLGGNDFLQGGAGNDNMAGGQGNDIYYVDAGDQVFEAAGEGDDTVVAFASFALGAGQSVDTLSAADGAGAINLTGNALAQSLYGNGSANVLAGNGGPDYLVGGAGSDTFVISSLATSGAGNVATIADYAAGEVVDITQILGLTAGTDPVAGGHVKVTSGGQLQVDANGGGDSWTTIANVSGSAAVTVRYLSGGSATQLSIARSASQTAMAAAVAAAGMTAVPAAAKAADESGGELELHALVSSVAIGTLETSDHGLAATSRIELGGETREALDAVTSSPIHLAARDADAGLVADALASPHAAAASPLPQGTEVPLAGEPLAHALVANGVMMPSAEQLQALPAALDAAGHSQLVGTVLADALAGGDASGPIDALLDAVAAHSGAAMGIEHLGQLAVGFDAGHGAFTAAAWYQAGFAVDAFGPSAEALAAHPDVVAQA